MSFNTIILVNLIYLTALWYVLSVIFFDQKNKMPQGLKSGEKELEDLEIRKEEAFLAMKDLELDYNTHKISEEEYLQTRQTALDQGAGLIKKIEVLKNKRSTSFKTDRITTPSQSSSSAQKFCTNCGAPRSLEAHFCGCCGKKLE